MKRKIIQIVDRAALPAEKVAQAEPDAWLHVIGKPGNRAEWASIEEDDTPNELMGWMDEPSSYRIDKPLYLAVPQPATTNKNSS